MFNSKFNSKSSDKALRIIRGASKAVKKLDIEFDDLFAVVKRYEEGGSLGFYERALAFGWLLMKADTFEQQMKLSKWPYCCYVHEALTWVVLEAKSIEQYKMGFEEACSHKFFDIASRFLCDAIAESNKRTVSISDICWIIESAKTLPYCSEGLQNGIKKFQTEVCKTQLLDFEDCLKLFNASGNIIFLNKTCGMNVSSLDECIEGIRVVLDKTNNSPDIQEMYWIVHTINSVYNSLSEVYERIDLFGVIDELLNIGAAGEYENHNLNELHDKLLEEIRVEFSEILKKDIDTEAQQLALASWDKMPQKALGVLLSMICDNPALNIKFMSYYIGYNN